MGKGGNDRYGYGVRMMVVLNHHGGATGCALAAGNVQERWVAELPCSSTRAGGPGPLDPKTHQPTETPPTEWMAVWPSCGAPSPRPILSDCGFRGEE